MTKWIPALVALLGIMLGVPSAAAAPIRPGAPQPWQMRPAFADEFNGAAGTAPNADRWKVEEIDLGAQEQQTYVNDRRTAAHDGNGNMVLTAIKETSASGRPYKSARLSSGFARSPFFSTYGRWEARMLLPSGQGVWPAFWGLGDWNAVQHWPRCGEIDVMESINSGSVSHGGIHTVAASDNSTHRNFGSHTATAPGGTWAGAWHTWRLDWTATEMKWSIDGNVWQTITRASVEGAGAKWLFDGTQPQAPILNLAVGGEWAGAASGWTTKRFLIDYVRIYTPKPRDVRAWSS